MEDFESSWLNSLKIAKEKAVASGNEALANYLDIKIKNDCVRFEASKLLFESLIRIAQEKISSGYKLEFTTKSPHQFQMKQAVLTGHLLEITFGFRKLTIEVGWTRKPEDGFMRGNALAYARITHFGKPKNNVELLLSAQDQQPRWFLIEPNGNLRHFQEIEKHVEELITY